MNDYVIYGANGYTGELIARAAVQRGHRPILAGRNAAALAALAGALGVEHRVFALDEPATVDAGIRGAALVLHCAGPFARTARPMADACLREAVHYLDITGEEDVLASLAARDAEARRAGIMLLPGAGFDVVPSDCLAAHLKRRLPSANRLALGFQTQTTVSRGTARTVLEGMGQGGLVRKAGVLQPVPAGWKTRRIDLGNGPVVAVTIPWGDVVTAHLSTGIPDIEVYMAAPLGVRIGLRLMRHLGWLLRMAVVQRFLAWRIRAGPPGPTAEQRRTGQSYLWGEVADDAGNVAVSRLRGPESYEMTVRTALAVVDKVRAGAAPVGFQTPATAYGPDFVLAVEGFRRTDEPMRGPNGSAEPARNPGRDPGEGNGLIQFP